MSKRSKPNIEEREHFARPPDLGCREQSAARTCQWPGCCEEGLYRAPLSRQNLRAYQWFCLKHIREFNQSWDYFEGMSSEEIEEHRRKDTTWHRPTWQFGSASTDPGTWHDPFGFFYSQEQSPPPKEPKVDSEQRQMMDILELDDDFTLDDLKTNYKRLAKHYHPDLNGGCAEAEERFKMINLAYCYIKDNQL